MTQKHDLIPPNVSLERLHEMKYPRRNPIEVEPAPESSRPGQGAGESCASPPCYEESYEHAASPLLVLSPRAAIVRANLAARELFRSPRERLLGRSIGAFVHPSDRERVIRSVVSNSVAAASFCARLLADEASGACVSVWFRVVVGTSGVRHLTLLEMDYETVSALRRTAPNETANRFIATLSHELRTPLTPVLAAIPLLRRLPNLSERSREIVELLHRNVALEARMIDELLDVASLSRNQLHLNRRPVELLSLLEAAVHSSRETACEKGTALVYECNIGECYALGDADRIRQIFDILLGNAVKFTPSGGSVHVRASLSVGKLRVEVQDNGIGFDRSDACLLFDAFRRGVRSSASGEGLGLRLALCKGLAELHGGQVSASSDGPGTGACFAVLLPTFSEMERNGSTQTLEYVEVTEITTAPRPRILLVEDHADTAEILTMLLDEHGYTITAADSIATALESNLSSIDLIISDIGLPDGTGMDLLRALRTFCSAPAIALSGFGMESDVDDSMRAGFACHLTKPVDFTNLLESIHSLLMNESQHQPEMRARG